MNKNHTKYIINKTYLNKTLSKENFWCASFKNVKFINCKINDSIFSDAIFDKVSFEKCLINNSNFTHVQFYRTTFLQTKLNKNNFRDAKKDRVSKINIKIPTLAIKKNPKKNPHLTGDEKKIFYELTKGKGYIHLKNVFSKKKIEKAYKILNKIVNGDKKIQSQQKKFSRDKKYNQKWIFNLLNKNKIFSEFIQPKSPMTAFKKILGNNFICGFYGANCLLPGSRGQIPHIDYPYYRFVAPGSKVPFTSKKNFILSCQILIPITKFDKENGSTSFLPHSHKFNKYPEKNIKNSSKFIQLDINPGSILIFNGLMWHHASNNFSSTKKRYGIISQYIPEFITPQLDLKKITNKKVINSDKKYLKQLLGVNLEFPSIRK